MQFRKLNGAEVTSAGRAFQTRAPATEKARRPSLTAGTHRSSEVEDRSLSRVGMLATDVNCRTNFWAVWNHWNLNFMAIRHWYMKVWTGEGNGSRMCTRLQKSWTRTPAFGRWNRRWTGMKINEAAAAAAAEDRDRWREIGLLRAANPSDEGSRHWTTTTLANCLWRNAYLSNYEVLWTNSWTFQPPKWGGQLHTARKNVWWYDEFGKLQLSESRLSSSDELARNRRMGIRKSEEWIDKPHRHDS